jgi:hypothetical protein
MAAPASDQPPKYQLCPSEGGVRIDLVVLDKLDRGEALGVKGVCIPEDELGTGPPTGRLIGRSARVLGQPVEFGPVYEPFHLLACMDDRRGHKHRSMTSAAEQNHRGPRRRESVEYQSLTAAAVRRTNEFGPYFDRR